MLVSRLGLVIISSLMKTPPLPGAHFTVRRIIKMKERINLIHAYFGSLTSFDRKVSTFDAVSARHHVSRSTVVEIIGRFIRSGHDFDSLKKKPGCGRKLKVIKDKATEDFLVSKTQLQRWVGLSLNKRCDLIK